MRKTEAYGLIVDFHTHTFPDKIAEKTIAYLTQKGGLDPYRGGTVDDLLDSMRRWGVDYSVVLPVATLPKQERSINALSAERNGRDRLFFAGGIHPDCEDVEGTLDFIKQSGLFGVKLHPDYQGVDFDDKRYLRIMDAAFDRGLYVVTHAGIDVGYRDHVHCTPDMILRALKSLGSKAENRLILAHMGGYELPDEVLQKLVGLPVYMDTAAVLKLYPEKCREIIKAHGADKILFASDSPWEHPGDFAEIIRSFGLTQDEEEQIFFRNAEKILGTCLEDRE